jgi:hypothetical protein
MKDESEQIRHDLASSKDFCEACAFSRQVHRTVKKPKTGVSDLCEMKAT